MIKNIKYLIREIMLLMACIVVFPIRTIVILAYKWHLWVQKWDKKIKKDHEDFYNNYE